MAANWKLLLFSILLIGYSCGSIHQNHSKIRFQKSEVSEVQPIQKKSFKIKPDHFVEFTSTFSNEELIIIDSLVPEPFRNENHDDAIFELSNPVLSSIVELPNDSILTLQKEDSFKRTTEQKELSHAGKVYFILGMSLIVIATGSVIASFFFTAAFAALAFYCYIIGFAFVLSSFLKFRKLRKDLLIYEREQTALEKVMFWVDFTLLLFPALLFLAFLAYVVLSFAS